MKIMIKIPEQFIYAITTSITSRVCLIVLCFLRQLVSLCYLYYAKEMSIKIDKQ